MEHVGRILVRLFGPDFDRITDAGQRALDDTTPQDRFCGALILGDPMVGPSGKRRGESKTTAHRGKDSTEG